MPPVMICTPPSWPLPKWGAPRRCGDHTVRGVGGDSGSPHGFGARVPPRGCLGRQGPPGSQDRAVTD
eukprot:1991585-Pyramimonas_sp.AAC.1